MAHVLDLEILAGDVDQLALFGQAHQVARAVDGLHVGLVQRVLHERGAGALAVAEVAQRHSRAADAELAGAAGGDFVVLLVQQQDALVGERHADGQALARLERAVHDVIGAVAGDLRRAVEVDVHHVRQILLQLVEVLDGHHLAGEHDGAQRRRNPVIQRVHRGDEAQRGHRPHQHRGPAVAQKVHELRRLGEVSGGDDLHRRAGEDAGVDVLDGDVEVKRRLIGQHVALSDAEDFGEAGDEIDHIAVADDHPLGRAGGAGGEVDVERVDVQHLRAHARQRGLVNRAFEQILEDEDVARHLHVAQRILVRAVGHHHRGGEGLQDRADARGGVAQVQLRIRAAGVHRAEEARDGLHGLVHVKADGRARGHARAKRGAHGAGQANQLGKGDRAAFVGEGGLVRQARGRRLQMIQNQVFHHQHSKMLFIQKQAADIRPQPLLYRRIPLQSREDYSIVSSYHTSPFSG